MLRSSFGTFDLNTVSLNDVKLLKCILSTPIPKLPYCSLIDTAQTIKLELIPSSLNRECDINIAIILRIKWNHVRSTFIMASFIFIAIIKSLRVNFHWLICDSSKFERLYCLQMNWRMIEAWA